MLPNLFRVLCLNVTFAIHIKYNFYFRSPQSVGCSPLVGHEGLATGPRKCLVSMPAHVCAYVHMRASPLSEQLAACAKPPPLPSHQKRWGSLFYFISNCIFVYLCF